MTKAKSEAKRNPRAPKPFDPKLELWERQPAESMPAYTAFSVHCDDRLSIQKVADKLSKSNTIRTYAGSIEIEGSRS